jgi:uncharacterized protein YcbK (DUF882 family)
MQSLPGLRGLAPALLVALATAGADAQPDIRNEKFFNQWRLENVERVRDFEAYLKTQGVEKVSPMHELLRSASMWRECRAQPFEVPPPQRWQEAANVLLLLKHLRETGVLGDFEVVSAYRSPALNKCAGGAPKSAHVFFAVDLAPLSLQEAQRLCGFWQQQGGRWKMGLSRYPTGRVHIDRTRWRTWGSDHTRKTSFCLGAR